MFLSTSPSSMSSSTCQGLNVNGPSAASPSRRASAPPLGVPTNSKKESNAEVSSSTGGGGGSGALSILGFGKRKSSTAAAAAASNGHTAPPPTALQYPTTTGGVGLSISSGAEYSMNMYALHEHGESHDEGDENSSVVDNSDVQVKVHNATDTVTSDDYDGVCDVDDDEHCRINHKAAVNFNVDGLKDVLKCASCHRFLFPPILQCVNGHMECKGCFDMKPQCGKCHQKMLDVPAKFAEMITEQFNVQCSYAEKGCSESVAFKSRRDHEEICPYKPVQCPEFDCSETRPMNEIFKHFRLEHHHHFVNAHGNVFNGDIRCDDSNMIMGVERKWAPTMMKVDEDEPGSGTQHFFLEILRTKHGVWHMWVWYLGEPDDAGSFRCEVAIKKRNREEDSELRYSGRVHSIRIPPHRIILSGCLLSFSDYTAAHFRYLGEGHQGHPVIDYKVAVSRIKKAPSSNERAMAAGLTKMLRRFSIDSGGSHKANKPSLLLDNNDA